MLRGVAILLVLWHHIVDPPRGLLQPVATVLSALKYVGWMGVDLFFVLSGFLVSGLVINEFNEQGSFQPIRFLIRRGFKIYPSYYILILVSFFIIPHNTFDANTARFICYLLVFLQNYHLDLLNTFTNVLFVHTWSLAVEEHFYFGLTLVAILLLKFCKSLRMLPAICLGVCLMALLMRIITFVWFHPSADLAVYET